MYHEFFSANLTFHKPHALVFHQTARIIIITVLIITKYVVLSNLSKLPSTSLLFYTGYLSILELPIS